MADPEKYSHSDKLAIALACVAGVMAIVLFLIEKTPISVVVLLTLMLALSVYPILHFTKSKTPRTICLIVILVGTVALGWAVWPKQRPSEVAVQMPPANAVKENSGTTDSVRVDVRRPARDAVADKVEHRKHAKTSSQDNSVHMDKGSKIEQQSGGPCSPNIVGGSNTVNCGPPPPPPLKLSWQISTNQSREEGTYTYIVTITVNIPMTPVAVGVLCSAPPYNISVGTHKGRASLNEHDGIQGSTAFVYYEGTPMTPHDELYVTLNSKTPLTVLDVRPAVIQGLND